MRYDQVDGEYVLSVLRDARDTLQDRRGSTYDFSEWTSCGVGHIYMAVAGDMAAVPADASEPKHETIYLAVIQRVAYALGWEPDLQENPAHFVSDRVGDAGKHRTAALHVVERAIDEIEAMERQAALQIADKAHEAELV